MASPLGTGGSVQVNDGKGSSIAVHIDEAPGLSSQGLSFATWGAAFVLSDLLHTLRPPPENPSDAKGFDILELGAGTGLVGISAAAELQGSGDATCVQQARNLHRYSHAMRQVLDASHSESSAPRTANPKGKSSCCASLQKS